MAAPATPGSEQIWLWIGTIGMALGLLYFLGRGWGVKDKKLRQFYAINIFVTTIAFSMYFAMATGFGLTEVELLDGTVLDIYWARYTDWLFTTPLLLLDLALLANADRETIYTLIGLDVFMIATGLIGAFAQEAIWRIVWWGISTGALLVLLYVLVGTLSEAAPSQSDAARSLTSTLKNLLIVLWLAYPVVWILGTEGTLGFIPLYAETAAFMVLDLTAKVGFGAYLLKNHDVLTSLGTGAGSAQPAD
ncbi:rhodopsin [Halonotius terrestris]|uniref:Rhodopsin n=1 Tax=Halonotius terrestris TaxID=2487750 RepID=A0A8J8TCK8_9EURY|nr:bacteriorhodopsin [Halonotius terrestris]TQQ81338.1 rhodopsin [Halonotius terrestris]